MDQHRDYGLDGHCAYSRLFCDGLRLSFGKILERHTHGQRTKRTHHARSALLLRTIMGNHASGHLGYRLAAARNRKPLRQLLQNLSAVSEVHAGGIRFLKHRCILLRDIAHVKDGRVD